MALFDTLISDVAGRFGLGSVATPLMREALHLVTGAPGGLGGLLEQFRGAGLGDAAASWLGNRDAKPLSGEQIESALGSNALGAVASRIGIAGPAAATALGYAMPKLIGVLTPGGQVPATLSSEVLSFLNPPATTTRVVETVTPRVAPRTEQVAPMAMHVLHDEPHMSRWLLPLVGALGLLGLGAYLLTGNQAPPPPPPVVRTAPVLPPVPVTSLPPRLAISNDDGFIRYSGTVHDEETRTNIINSLRAVFGADRVQGDIAIDLNRGAAPWMVNFRSALNNLRVPGVQALFEGNSVNLGGMINEGDRDRISTAMRGVLGGGLVYGTISDRVGTLVTDANDRVLNSLTALRSGFNANDLVGALNLSIINFATGSADIPAGNMALLNNAAARIKQLPATTVIEIAGHTDNTGDAAANVTLSQARAESIRAALLRAGVEPGMLVARGYGSAQPVASNDLLEGRFRNRRIEYRVVRS